MEVTVRDRQSLFDISVQILGGIEGVFALAECNGLGITDRLRDGQVLTWDVSYTVNDKYGRNMRCAVLYLPQT